MGLPAASPNGKSTKSERYCHDLVPERVVSLFSQLKLDQQRLYTIGIHRIKTEDMVIDVSYESRLWRHKFTQLSFRKRTEMGSTLSLDNGLFHFITVHPLWMSTSRGSQAEFPGGWFRATSGGYSCDCVLSRGHFSSVRRVHL